MQFSRSHGSLYTDPRVFADELERIWYTTWVFVGHTSEIPATNDWVRKRLGLQDVIMTRLGDGRVALLVNRCPHRANQVCEGAAGNTASFRCPYHGWTFNPDGTMRQAPFAAGYEGRRNVGVDMARVPRVDEYQGFVFASFAADGPTLVEHLGEAAVELDRLARLSPENRVELTAGWLKFRTRANWKMVAENETDGYHPQFVHSSIFRVNDSPIGALYGEKSVAVARDLGGGHTELDLKPEFVRQGEPMRWFGTTPDKVPEYMAAMSAALGAQEAERRLIEGAPHVMIFPNLFIAEIHVLNVQPVAVGETIQYVTAVQLAGTGELNQRMVSQSLGSFSPAGLLLADDSEMYQRNQAGAEQRAPEWLNLSRGAHRETTDERGLRVGHVTDEVTQRGFWRHYRHLMTEGA